MPYTVIIGKDTDRASLLASNPKGDVVFFETAAAMISSHAPAMPWIDWLDSIDRPKHGTCGTRGRITSKPYGVGPNCLAKADRNSPCPCSSGLKFKKCCHGLKWQAIGEKFATRMLSTGSHEENLVWARLVMNHHIVFNRPAMFKVGVEQVVASYLGIK